MKRLIRLTESDIRRMVMEAVYEKAGIDSEDDMASELGSEESGFGNNEADDTEMYSEPQNDYESEEDMDLNAADKNADVNTALHNMVNAYLDMYANQDAQSKKRYESIKQRAIQLFSNSYSAYNAMVWGVGGENRHQSPDAAFNEATKYVNVTQPDGTVAMYSINDVERTPDGGFKENIDSYTATSSETEPQSVTVEEYEAMDDAHKDLYEPVYNGEFILKPGAKPLQVTDKKTGKVSNRKPQSTLFGQVDMSQFSPKPGMSGTDWNNLLNDYAEHYKDNKAISRTVKGETSIGNSRMLLQPEKLVDGIGHVITSDFFEGVNIHGNDSFVPNEKDIMVASVQSMGSTPNCLLNKLCYFLKTYTSHYVATHRKEIEAYLQGNKSLDTQSEKALAGSFDNGNYEEVPMEYSDDKADSNEHSYDYVTQQLYSILNALLEQDDKGIYMLKKIMQRIPKEQRWGGFQPYYIDVLRVTIKVLKSFNEYARQHNITVDDIRDNYDLSKPVCDEYKRMYDNGEIETKLVGYWAVNHAYKDIKTCAMYYRAMLDDVELDNLGGNNNGTFGESRMHKYMHRIISETLNRMFRNRLI